MATLAGARVELGEVERGARGDRCGGVGCGEHFFERGACTGVVAGELGDHGVAELGRDAVELGRDAGCRIGNARLGRGRWREWLGAAAAIVAGEEREQHQQTQLGADTRVVVPTGW